MVVAPDLGKCIGFPVVDGVPTSDGRIVFNASLFCESCGKRRGQATTSAKDADATLDTLTKQLKRQASCPFSK